MYGCGTVDELKDLLFTGETFWAKFRKIEQLARDNLSFSGKHGMIEFNIDEKGVSIQECL